MLATLALLSHSLQPIVLVPPFYGSNLWASYDNVDLPWYCPQSANDTLWWIDPLLLVPPRYNCLLNVLLTDLDEEGNVVNYNNITVKVHDFGGDESARFAAYFKHTKISFYATYAVLIDRLKEKGYTIKRDIYVAPYDWRLAPTYSYEFFKDFKLLAEKSLEENNEKMTIFAFSLGGYLIQQFLSKQVTQEWKDKYVEKVIFLSPSFTGGGSTLFNMWMKRTPFLPWFQNQFLESIFEAWPIVHSHIPNIIIYENQTMIYGPDGEEFKPKDILGLMIEKKVLNKKYQTVYKKSEALANEKPVETGVPTYLLYNSGRPTPFSLNFSKGFDKEPEKIMSGGDETVLAYGLEKTCQLWKNVKCYDFFNSSQNYEHMAMVSNNNVIDLIFNITNDIPTFNENGAGILFK